MTEDEARTWIAARWPNEDVVKLDAFVELVSRENERQNLVSAASLATIWSRHIVDSAQLVELADDVDGLWIDVGSGGGFPGIVVAALRGGDITLAEPRTKRATFLADAASQLGLPNVSVHAGRVEQLSTPAAIISARAVATPENLFAMTQRVATSDTRYILHGGRSAEVGLQEARRSWRGVFHVEQSATEADSKMIVATQVRRK